MSDGGSTARLDVALGIFDPASRNDRLAFLPFDQMARVLGPRWAHLKSSAIQSAREIMESQLAAGDRYLCDGDQGFLILFENGHAHRTHSHLENLSKLLRRQAEEMAREAGLDMDSPGAVAAKVLGRIQASTEEVEAKARMAMESLKEDGESLLRRVFNMKRQPAPFRLVSFTKETQEQVDTVLAAHSGSEEKRADIDLMALGHAANMVLDRPNARPSVAAVDLHFSTLYNKATSAEFYSILKRLPPMARDNLILTVTDIPDDLIAGRVAEIISPLNSFSMLRMVRLKAPDLGNLNPPMAQVNLVALDFSTFARWKQRDEVKIERFFARVRQHYGRILIDRVGSAKQAQAVASARPDFMGIDAARNS